MHELSIALSIIEGVEEELAKHEGERVEVVHLRLGRMSGVVKEALQFCFETASAGTRLEGSRLHIEELPVTIYCATCASVRPAISMQNLHCAECGTPGGDVRQGRELQVFAIELSTMDEAHEQHAAAG